MQLERAAEAYSCADYAFRAYAKVEETAPVAAIGRNCPPPQVLQVGAPEPACFRIGDLARNLPWMQP